MVKSRMLKASLDALVDLFCKDHIETLMHMHSCRAIMRLFCQQLKMSIDDCVVAEDAAFYHDVGKVFFRTLIHSERALTEAEYDVIKSHTCYGYKVLMECTNLSKDVVETAMYHHERWDGTGYYGLESVEIPRLSRIMAIIDSYDSMRSIRNYRVQLDHAESIRILNNPSKYDPELLSEFLQIPKDELDRIIEFYHNEEQMTRLIHDDKANFLKVT